MKSTLNKHLRFDTVRFVTKSNYLLSYNDNLFTNNFDFKRGLIKSILFSSNQGKNIVPFMLYISNNYYSDRLTIEFSSKLLLEDYPQLISMDSFGKCLENIEKLGICRLDIDSILNDCYFNKLHITKDVEMVLTDEILNTLNQCTGQYRRYKWEIYNGTSIRFSNDILTARNKEELLIYNKSCEITHGKNKQFLSMLTPANRIKVISYFDNKTRFEVKLENKQKIMREFGIPNTDFWSIFGVNQNIILRQFDKIFSSVKMSNQNHLFVDNFSSYGAFNIVSRHNCNLKSIEQEIKNFGLYGNSSRAAMYKQMKKLRLMAEHINNQELSSNVIIKEIRSKLENKEITDNS